MQKTPGKEVVPLSKWPRKKPTIPSPVKKTASAQLPESKKEIFDGIVVEKKTKRVPSSIPENILQPHDTNVLGDGNCGFRCLALHLFGDENKWAEIKKEMLQFSLSKMGIYEGVFGYSAIRFKNVLRKNAAWFFTPDCAQLAADTFRMPLVVFESDGDSITFLPVFQSVEQKAVILAMDNVHVRVYKVKPGRLFKFPRLNPQHEPVCRRRNYTQGAQNMKILHGALKEEPVLQVDQQPDETPLQDNDLSVLDIELPGEAAASQQSEPPGQPNIEQHGESSTQSIQDIEQPDDLQLVEQEDQDMKIDEVNKNEDENNDENVAMKGRFI